MLVDTCPAPQIAGCGVDIEADGGSIFHSREFKRIKNECFNYIIFETSCQTSSAISSRDIISSFFTHSISAKFR